MKKFIIALMIVSLAVCSVFAIDGLKVGGELGYTRYGITMKTENAKISIGVGGFAFAGVAEYQVVNNVDVVAKIGMNINGKPHSKTVIGDVVIENTGDEAIPVHFTAYVGGKYTYVIDSKFSTSVGLGLDFTVGKIDKDSEKAGIFLGLKADIAGKYNITDKLAVGLGGGFTWVFVDTAPELEEPKKDTKEAGGSVFEHRFGVSAGVTYSF